LRYILIPLALACASVSVYAKDLGVQGTVWPIVERDIRQMMVEQAANVEWSKVQGEIADSGRAYLDNLPKRRMTSVESTSTVWLDPSIELTSDIQVPVKGADGSFSWQVLAAKGTRVNPLAQTRPLTALLFFDGADPAQLSAVAAVLKTEPLRVVPVEAGRGSMRDNNERLARPVFHANDAMMGRFQVRSLPTLVYPGMADRALFLGVTSFAAPFSPREMLSAWPELTQLPATSETR
jgi:conjugal transfer pilus assembly protein TraW